MNATAPAAASYADVKLLTETFALGAVAALRDAGKAKVRVIRATPSAVLFIADGGAVLTSAVCADEEYPLICLGSFEQADDLTFGTAARLALPAKTLDEAIEAVVAWALRSA